MKKGIFFIYLLIFSFAILAQNPPFFTNNVESGAPSNEMYWIHQDKVGYIWVGCDAGLYRFNGIRFEQFTSPELNARSATGIIESKTSGRIYAYNFNRQLFYIQNDKLFVVSNWNKSVNGLADDGQGNIWITSSEGTFKLNESDNKITTVISSNHYLGPNESNHTSHAISNQNGRVFYQNGARVLIWKNNKEKVIQLDERYMQQILLLSRFSDYPWIFSSNGEKILRFTNGTYTDYFDAKLLNLLKGKKINYLFESPDGKLWIGTYSGLICHDVIRGKTQLMYEQYSFSNGIYDKDGNYWFTTLHNGLIRIPNMQVSSWQSLNDVGSIEQFSHISMHNEKVFFGGTNGYITCMNTQSGELEKLYHEPLSDIGAMYFDPVDNCLYFNKISSIYKFKSGVFQLVNKNARPIKSMLRVQNGYFFLSSQGLFYTKSIHEPLEKKNMIDLDWYRDICISPFSSSIFVASNSGLKELYPVGNTYRVRKDHFRGKQIISISSDPIKNVIYAYSFDGGVYSIDKQNTIKKITQLGNNIRVSQIRFHAYRLFMTSNKGILVLDTETKKQILFDRYSGLSSNNIRSIEFYGDTCWVAGENIQKIPLSLFKFEKVKSSIILRKILVNGESVNQKNLIELNYNDKLTLIADGISYRSNGDFQFAYRIKELNSNWIKVPGGVEKIDFASLPTGYITIELKLIDHEGIDSATIISFNLYVCPPFWQRWWFYILLTLTTLLLAFIVFKIRLKVIRRKQAQELKRIKLENELRLTQQNALKAQMNPHFLFNVLNSIKGYIYENDKKNASRYLSDFSSLVRKVLELTSLTDVSLEEEIETLKLYIELESMLLQSDFSYAILVDDNVDISGIQIPTLLLQPFVENAFKHGLRHKTGSKQLLIKISTNAIKDILTIEITDDGIGRAASKLINDQNGVKHKSFALSAVEQRIELLNFEKRDLVGVEIIDNFEKGQPIGTTIIIRIHV